MTHAERAARRAAECFLQTYRERVSQIDNYYAQVPRWAPAVLRNIPGRTPGELDMLQRLSAGMSTVMAYENPDLQQVALEKVPVDRLHQEAHAALGESQNGDDFADSLMRRLLHWFKHEFFTWTNNPPCDSCGAADTLAAGMAPPTPQDISDGAQRVEVYTCGACRSTTRFPRYNRVARLLQTRRGRCGEWANCFTLIARAMGFDVRYVIDWTDHVWTEYYSATRRRWVHLDSCENAFDQPLVYESGWGKQLSYVFAFSPYGCVDVVHRYSRNLGPVVARRRQCSELWLAAALAEIRAVQLSAVDRVVCVEQCLRMLDEQCELIRGPLRADQAGERLERISGAV